MSFVPTHSWVGLPDAPKLGFLLHGIFGSGNNFRSFARRLVAARPDYAFVLPDTRCHAGSFDAPAPHTLKTCADDLATLAMTLGRNPSVVIGHSFGGKVALAYAEERHAMLEAVFVLDSNPGAQTLNPESEIARVFAALKRAPEHPASREQAAQALEAEGLNPAIATWLTQNLRRTANADDGFSWTLNLPAIEDLLRDYVQRDFWSYLQGVPEPAIVDHATAERATVAPAKSRTFFVMADKSDRISPEIRARAEALAPHVQSFVLPNSGHWVHVDNPDGLLEIIAPRLP